MTKVLVTLYPWENPKLYDCEFSVAVGDLVIVASEYSNEIGRIEMIDVNSKDATTERILRVATARDRSVYESHNSQKDELVEICKSEIKKIGLAMKMIDAMPSLDGKQIIFAFTADGR